MNRFILCLCIALGLLLAYSSARAVEGAQCELTIYQTDPAHDSAQVLLVADTATLVQGIRANGFMTALSMEIELRTVDTDAVDFITHVVTLGPPVNTYSREFRCVYGLPAKIDHIVGKGGALYTLSIRPLKPLDVDTSACGYIHYRKDDFKFDPSANVDIYFVPQSAGDFYWNMVKGLMEDRYRQFADINKFTLPGKYLLYLCPCPIYSVIWDKRFGMMVDPTKMTCFANFTIQFNAADPFLLMYASAARHYGYTPPFLLEGFAGYLSMSAFDMKEIVADKKQLPLTSLMATHAYMTAEPRVADKTASSFVRYLIDQYKFDKFLVAYRAADDLNLAATLERIYGKPVAQLEQDWLHYIDTVSVRTEALSIFADQAEAMFSYPLMLHYRTAQLAQTETRRDSMSVIGELVRGYFFNGEYAEAESWQQKLVAMDNTNPMQTMSLAGYEMMRGAYDPSRKLLQEAQAKDTTKNQLIGFNLAMNYLYSGDSAKARQLLTNIVDSLRPGGPLLESKLLLASLLQRSKNQADHDKALSLCREVTTVINQQGKSVAPSPALYLWAGVAALGAGDTGNANNLLLTAVYYETRPFYQALVYLWLGKTADVRGERDVAEQYYRKVLALPAAAYHLAEAKALMQKKYVQ